MLWSFKLDRLQPAKLILSQNISNFLPFILGAPISYYCREQGLKMGKGNHPQVIETQGFLYFGHSNWSQMVQLLKHLQPAKLILSQNISIFLTPISHYCRERRRKERVSQFFDLP